MKASDYPVRANLFDASALVKVYVDEPRCDIVREYFHNCAPTKYTTPFCLYEALNILKRKRNDGHLSTEQYHKRCVSMVSWFRVGATRINDVDLMEPPVLFRVLALSDRHDLDVSDAFQIDSLKNGCFSRFGYHNASLLITADRALAAAAACENIKVWNVLVDDVAPV